MNIHKKLLIFFALICIGISVHANSAPNILGTFHILPTQQELDAEQHKKAQESEFTDSLLNSIEIDIDTKEAYALNKALLYMPNILGGLNKLQFNTISLPPLSYARTAGIIAMVGDSAMIVYPSQLSPETTDPIPEWFKKSLRFQNQIKEASFRMMVSNPYMVEYADWELPYPPHLPEEDFSFHAFLQRMKLPEINPDEKVILPEIEHKHRNWLHYFNVGLQVSQAYVSANWYQGGNSYLAGLFNFEWNVELNTVYHPNLLFQSSLQYKLAVNSNPKGSLHKYNTSQDLFQYNLKTGLKAFNHWFYSLNALFQTQIFNSYPEDALERQSTFLSPGTLNLGLGMTYTLEKKRLNLTVSLSPLAYNLKTCIASDIDHLQFNISQDKKTLSEIGSSAEANLTWNLTDNISWKSRLFLFTDYGYFLADWGNTFNFQINKILSTQIYLHPRFDSSSDTHTKWKHWMLHEILSFGISYTFSTPK